MQDTEDEMSAYVCLSVYFFHVYIITVPCLFSSTIYVKISNKGSKKVRFSRGGHHDWCTFTRYLDDFRYFVSFSSEKKL